MSALPDVICPRHHAYPLQAHCRDCGVGMCELCTVAVPGVGEFCWECAGRRGGLHRRPRARSNGVGLAAADVVTSRRWWRRR